MTLLGFVAALAVLFVGIELWFRFNPWTKLEDMRDLNASLWWLVRRGADEAFVELSWEGSDDRILVRKTLVGPRKIRLEVSSSRHTRNASDAPVVFPIQLEEFVGPEAPSALHGPTVQRVRHEIERRAALFNLVLVPDARIRNKAILAFNMPSSTGLPDD